MNMEKLSVELKLNHTHNEHCEQEVFVYMSEDYIGHRVSVTMVNPDNDEEDLDIPERGTCMFDEELYEPNLMLSVPKSLLKSYIGSSYVFRVAVLNEDDEVMSTVESMDIRVESSETFTNRDLGFRLVATRRSNGECFSELFQPLNFELDDGYRLVFATLIQGNYVSFCMRDNELEFMVKGEEKFSIMATTVEQLVERMYLEPVVCKMMESTKFIERIFEPKVFSESLRNITNFNINRLLREQQLNKLQKARTPSASV